MKTIGLFRAAACAALMAVFISPVIASSDSITATTSTMPIAIYEDSNGTRKLQDMAANIFASRLPLAVSNENNGFLLVKIDNRDVWVDAGQVTVNRPTKKASCEEVAARMGTTRGAEAGVSRGAGPKTIPCVR